MAGLVNAGKRIRALRRKRGLSQQQLAEISGLSQSSISYIEAGDRSPTLRTIEKIATGLGIESSELLVLCCTADFDSEKLKEEGDLAS